MIEEKIKYKKIKHKLMRACAFDISEIISFEKQVLNDSSEFTSKRNLKRLIQESKSEVLLIRSNKQLCAYGIATLRHFKNSPSGHIYKIAVMPDFRNYGFATEILSELENFIINNCIYKIFAEVRESNKASLNLFNKLGYIPIGKQFGYYTSLDDSYELENGIKLCKTIINNNL